MRKKRLLNAARCCSLALLLFLIPMLRNLSMGGQTGTMESYFLFNFAGPSPTGSDFMTMMLQLVPNVMVLYLLSGKMLEDCSISYVYVFTRVGKKGPWLRQQTLQLLAQIILVFVLVFATCFAFGSSAGLRVGESGAGIYARLLLFQCGTLFLLSFVQNFFSLSLGRTQSFLLLLIFYVVCVGVGLLRYNTSPATNFIVSMLPPNSQMYTWHSDCPLPSGTEELFAPPLAGFTTTRTVIVLCTYFIIFYAIVSVIFEKKDLAELIKGESQ